MTGPSEKTTHESSEVPKSTEGNLSSSQGDYPPDETIIANTTLVEEILEDALWVSTNLLLVLMEEQDNHLNYPSPDLPMKKEQPQIKKILVSYALRSIKPVVYRDKIKVQREGS